VESGKSHASPGSSLPGFCGHLAGTLGKELEEKVPEVPEALLSCARDELTAATSLRCVAKADDDGGGASWESGCRCAVSDDNKLQHNNSLAATMYSVISYNIGSGS
jgi:hypothetical protein